MAGDKPHVFIVEARFYEDIADDLARGAVAAIESVGGTYERAAVPGVFEIPAAIRFMIKSMELIGMRRRVDAYVALGCVIRGETSHYDIVCRESARGIGELALSYTLALGYGVLTCDDEEQARTRAAPDGRDKGGEAARAALHMLGLKRQLGYFPR